MQDSQINANSKKVQMLTDKTLDKIDKFFDDFDNDTTTDAMVNKLQKKAYLIMAKVTDYIFKKHEQWDKSGEAPTISVEILQFENIIPKSNYKNMKYREFTGGFFDELRDKFVNLVNANEDVMIIANYVF